MAGPCEYLLFLWKVKNFLSFWAAAVLSRRTVVHSITFTMLFCILLTPRKWDSVFLFLNVMSLVNIHYLCSYKTHIWLLDCQILSRFTPFITNLMFSQFCDINGLWVTWCFLQRLVQGGPGGCLKGPGSQKPLPTTFSPSDQTQVVYRVVGSRSHVKKSDSSQQTDSSAFR